eukprot:gene5600-4563_t
MRFSTFASMAGVARLLAASTLFLIIRSTATAAKTFEDSSYSESYSFIHPEGEAAVAKVSPPPHPLPRWPATYNMSLSTIIMPCEYEKFITDPTIRKFGVVDLDWSNSKQLWVQGDHMQCEENLVKQAIIMKEETPDSKTGLLNPAIDGFFMDDTWSDDGFGIGHPGAEVQDIGLSHQDLVDLQGNWTANMAVVKAAIVEHNGFVWQDMVCVGGSTPVKCEGYNGTQAGPPITQEHCAERLREACQPTSSYQTGALFYGFKDKGNEGPKTVPLEDF